jgi:hypothetical protein
MLYGFGNPDPGLGQSQKYGRVKRVNGIQTLPLFITGSPTPFQVSYKISIRISFKILIDKSMA